MAFHEATASIFKTLFGEKQLGAPAPVFQPGESNFTAPDIGTDNNFSDMLQTILAQSPVNILEGLIGKPEERGQELAAQVQAQPQQEFAGPPQMNPAEGSPGFVGPANIPSGEELGPFSKFFGNLDQNLQSPSKVIGLGLLNQLDPRLAGLGLFAGGLFGQNN